MPSCRQFAPSVYGILRARATKALAQAQPDAFDAIRPPRSRHPHFSNPIMSLIALNKPFGTLCQFSPHETRPTLAMHIARPDVYPAGRLDADSEGLLLLTDDGTLQARITEPRRKLVKRYWAQVDGDPSDAALARLACGVDLGDFTTGAAQVRRLDHADLVTTPLWPRDPPIRFRASIPAVWIELAISEGKNRQVRRMTAAVGHPTLRLVRIAMGDVDIFSLGLQPGESTDLDVNAPWADHPDEAAPRPERQSPRAAKPRSFERARPRPRSGAAGNATNRTAAGKRKNFRIF